MLLTDSFLLVLILLASFSIRLGYGYVPVNDTIFWLIFGAPAIAVPIFVRFGLYRAVIRYLGFDALWSIVQAVSLYTLVWGILSFMLAVDGIPRSIIVINWVISILIIGGLRMVARWMLTSGKNIDNNKASGEKKRVLFYGAGDAGIQLVGALSHSSEYICVGFVDDLKELQGRKIWGLEVYSPDLIGGIIKKLSVS